MMNNFSAILYIINFTCICFTVIHNHIKLIRVKLQPEYFFRSFSFRSFKQDYILHHSSAHCVKYSADNITLIIFADF